MGFFSALLGAVLAAFLLELDVFALRIYYYDYDTRVAPQAVIEKVVEKEVVTCSATT